MTDEERIARGHAAASELRVTEEAFQALEADLMRRMLDTTEPEQVLHFHRSLTNLASVKHALTLCVADGNAVAAISAAGLARS